MYKYQGNQENRGNIMYLEIEKVCINALVQVIKSSNGRYNPPFQHQNRLYYAGDPRRPFEVTDISLKSASNVLSVSAVRIVIRTDAYGSSYITNGSFGFLLGRNVSPIAIASNGSPVAVPVP